MSGSAGLCDLLLIHAHCPTCGAPTTYDPEEHTFYNLNGGEHHVCDEDGGVLVCECGALLARSRYGHVYDRETRRPHLCELDVDRIERDLAFDRRSWRRK